MTPKATRRIIGYAKGIVISVAFVLFVQHWIVAFILIPGWCLALWHHRDLEREIAELNQQRNERDNP